MLKSMLKTLLGGAARAPQATLDDVQTLLDAGREPDAVALLRRICIADGEAFEPRLALGRLLYARGEPGAARAPLEQAVELEPAHGEARYLLARVLTDFREFARAAELLGTVTRVRPDWGEGWVALADALAGAGEIDAAEDAYLRALELAPQLAAVPYNYGILLEKMARVDEAIGFYRRALALAPEAKHARSNLLFALNRSEAASPEAVFREHLEWARLHAEPLTAAAAPHARPRHARGRLRVGYVSGDFREHPVGYFCGPVLRHHDRSAFEVYCYSDVRAPDALTAELRGLDIVWRDTRALDDAALAALVREDGVDILVDLAGHTAGDRLLAFARRPAPVQVTWMGYPNTTGMSAMTHRITDAHADPPGKTEHLHTEKLVRLPEIYLSFAVPRERIAPGEAPVLTRGYPTFGSFNVAPKLTPHMLALWARVLRELPEARLTIITLPQGRTRERIARIFADAGVDRSRLDLRGTLTHREFLEAHRDVDIALDCYPYHGTTTTAHTLWMGVPLVTLAGAVHAARVGVSMLANAGLPELVAESEDEYVRVAVALARDVSRLVALRASLRSRMLAAPNMDGARYTRFLEAAFLKMREEWLGAVTRS